MSRAAMIQAGPGQKKAFAFLLRHLGAVGCAAALAFARVLGFTAVVARFTSTLALARILTLASVLFFHLLVGWRLIGLRGNSQAREKMRCLNRCAGTSKQTSECCTSY